MAQKKEERRKYSRYGTQMKVFFQVKYDIRTKVEFKVLASKNDCESRSHSGISKNISVEGLCFMSDKQLVKGDRLSLDVYAPNTKIPVAMEGEVCWSKRIEDNNDPKGVFNTGVKLISVNGRLVAESIHLDKEYQVVWSEALESVFGNFALLVKRLKEEKKD